jgi:hypothetical protein
VVVGPGAAVVDAARVLSVVRSGSSPSHCHITKAPMATATNRPRDSQPNHRFGLDEPDGGSPGGDGGSPGGPGDSGGCGNGRVGSVIVLLYRAVRPGEDGAGDGAHEPTGGWFQRTFRYFKLMQVKLALMATHFFKNNNNFRRGTKVSNWFPKNFKVIRLVLNSNL